MLLMCCWLACIIISFLQCQVSNSEVPDAVGAVGSVVQALLWAIDTHICIVCDAHTADEDWYIRVVPASLPQGYSVVNADGAGTLRLLCVCRCNMCQTEQKDNSQPSQ